MEKIDLFKETFRDYLDLVDKKDLDDATDFLYDLEENYNNADVTSGQTCYSWDEINTFVYEVFK